MSFIGIQRALFFVSLSLLVIACSGDDDPRQLVEIQVTNQSSELPVGITSKLEAAAYYDDGSTSYATEDVTWSSSNSSIATVVDGVMTGVSTGNVTAVASLAGISGTVDAVITPAFITQIQTTSPSNSLTAGFTQSYTARGSYSDGLTFDITDDVTWLSTDPTIASIDTNTSPGFATAIIPGEVFITATLETVTSIAQPLRVNKATLTKIDVTPVIAAIPIGLSTKFTAMGTFTDGKISDISTDVVWRREGPAFVNIDETGLATASSSFDETGLVKVRADRVDLMSNTVNLLVIQAQLLSISVTPSTQFLPKGTAMQYKAEGMYTDGSTYDLIDHPQLGWHSSNTDSATITSDGVASANELGFNEVTASVFNLVSDPADLTVTPPVVVSVAVTPAEDMVVSRGADIFYKAEATFSDQNVFDVTNFGQVKWISDNHNVANVISGIAKGVGSDSVPANISATIQGQSGSSKLIGADCTSVSNSDMDFICPLEKSAADQIGTPTPIGFPEDGTTGPVGVSFALMNLSTAKLYCDDLFYNNQTDWRLPTSIEMAALFDTIDGDPVDPDVLFADHKWPLGKAYWTISVSGTQPIQILMTNGIQATSDPATLNYAACVRTSPSQ